MKEIQTIQHEDPLVSAISIPGQNNSTGMQLQGIGKIHPDFKIVPGPSWAYNRFQNLADGVAVAKLKATFDVIGLLDDVPLPAKIGFNRQQSEPGAFVIFAYASANNLPLLSSLAQRFPYSAIISPLDKRGRSIPESKTEIINPPI